MPRGKDSRDHPGRRPVDPRITNTQDNDDAPPHGIPRPDTSNIRHEDDAPPHGIPRPSVWTEDRRAAYEKASSWGGKGSDSATKDFVDNSITEDNSDIYTEGEKDTPEDAKEREDLKEERLKKGHY